MEAVDFNREEEEEEEAPRVVFSVDNLLAKRLQMLKGAERVAQVQEIITKAPRGEEENKAQSGSNEKEAEEMDALLPERNPHVAQTFLNKNSSYRCRTDLPFTRILAADSPRLQYRRRKGEAKTVIHWGQRKLLLSEIEFLTLHGQEGCKVVYAGAAPGTHIAYLAELFPQMRFLLVDPAPFTESVRRFGRRVEVVQGLFTNEFAEKLAAMHTNYPMLFISDVRSADPSIMTETEVDLRVREDMEAQQRWHCILRPTASMLKFRLPWPAGVTSYLAGDVYLPVWGPVTTTEARLVVLRDSQPRDWDHTTYEQQMFYFNTCMRPALYPHAATDACSGIDHCYDCTAEVHILASYIRKYRSVVEAELPRQIRVMSRAISTELSRDRTLASPNSDPEERARGIKNRQWIAGSPAYMGQRQSHHRNAEGGFQRYPQEHRRGHEHCTKRKREEASSVQPTKPQNGHVDKRARLNYENPLDRPLTPRPLRRREKERNIPAQAPQSEKRGPAFAPFVKEPAAKPRKD